MKSGWNERLGRCCNTLCLIALDDWCGLVVLSKQNFTIPGKGPKYCEIPQSAVDSSSGWIMFPWIELRNMERYSIAWVWGFLVRLYGLSQYSFIPIQSTDLILLIFSYELYFHLNMWIYVNNLNKKKVASGKMENFQFVHN